VVTRKNCHEKGTVAVMENLTIFSVNKSTMSSILGKMPENDDSRHWRLGKTIADYHGWAENHLLFAIEVPHRALTNDQWNGRTTLLNTTPTDTLIGRV
jgi:hypothetical protein